VVFHAFGAAFQALLRDLPDGLLLAFFGRKPLGHEVALGETVANNAFVAGTAQDSQSREDGDERESPHHGITSSLAWLALAANAERAFGLVAETAASCYPCAPMRENIRLLSSAGTGFSYYTKKNKRTQTNKLEVKKYDPIARKHVSFKETKMPPHSK
jgi:large subunit ribosomal protein L33